MNVFYIPTTDETMGLATTLALYYFLRERRSSHSSRFYRAPLPKATVRELTTLFHLLDENKDGFIDMKEFKVFQQFIHSIDYHFNRVNYARNGTISLEEWLRFGRECLPRSTSIQFLIHCVPEIQCGFTEAKLKTATRKTKFRLSKRNKIGCDATFTNAELDKTLLKALSSKRPSQSWADWCASFW